MDVLGYKAFYKGLINNYGMKFSVGKIYFMPGVIKFGLNGNGFHMCKNIEDTFRYFNTFDYDIDICEVKGSLDVCEGKDEYYGYYDMYSVKLIEILKKSYYQEKIFDIYNSNI